MFEIAERYASGDLRPDDWGPLVDALQSLPGVAFAKIDEWPLSGAPDLMVFPLMSSEPGNLHVSVQLSDPAAFDPCHRAVELALKSISRALAGTGGRRPGLLPSDDTLLSVVGRWSMVAVLIMDAEFSIVWLNDGFTRMLGYTLDEVRGRHPADFLHGEELASKVLAALEREGRFRGEVRTRTKSGTEALVDLDLYPHFDSRGNLAGYVAMRIDLTERTRITQEIADSETRFRDLVEISVDWYWETDAQGRYTTMQGDWPTQGYEELLGRSGLEVMSETTDPDLLAAHQKDIEQRRPFKDFRFPVWAAKDKKVWITGNGRPYFDAAGRYMGYRGTGRNITEEVEARETVDRMVRALNFMPNYVALFDEHERLIFANERYHEFYDFFRVGTTKQEILETQARMGLIEDPETEIPLRMQQFRSSSSKVDVRWGDRWFRLRETKLPDGGYLSVSSDITDRKIQELELLEAKEQAEQANAAKSSFLARMSHELRTPLNAILGLSDMIMTFGDQLPKAKTREYVGDIYGAGSMLLSHIEDILNFARLDAGVLEMKPESIDVRAEAVRLIRLMQPIASKRDIRLRATIPKTLPKLHMDARAFEQVMMNLVANAVNHSGRNTRVLVEALPKGKMISLTITDQGYGIRKSDLKRIFEPFYQSGDAKLSRESGTGLGLAIVKSLVEKNDGEISIESALGKGTCVTLSLPSAEAGPD